MPSPQYSSWAPTVPDRPLFLPRPFFQIGSGHSGLNQETAWVSCSGQLLASLRWRRFGKRLNRIRLLNPTSESIRVTAAQIARQRHAIPAVGGAALAAADARDCRHGCGMGAVQGPCAPSGGMGRDGPGRLALGDAPHSPPPHVFAADAERVPASPGSHRGPRARVPRPCHQCLLPRRHRGGGRLGR